MTNRSAERIRSLKECRPYYLSEHQHKVSSVLHFTGTSLILLWVGLAIVQPNAWWLVLIPLGGYSLALVGHFFFDNNKLYTFNYPGYSLASDFILWRHLLTGKGKFNTSGRLTGERSMAACR